HVEPEVELAQHRRAVRVNDRDFVERLDRRGEVLGGREVESDTLVHPRTGGGKLKAIRSSTGTVATGPSFSIILTLDCAWRTLLALALKRSTKACMCLRGAAILACCAASCSSRSARVRSKRS